MCCFILALLIVVVIHATCWACSHNVEVLLFLLPFLVQENICPRTQKDEVWLNNLRLVINSVSIPQGLQVRRIGSQRYSLEKWRKKAKIGAAAGVPFLLWDCRILYCSSIPGATGVNNWLSLLYGEGICTFISCNWYQNSNLMSIVDVSSHDVQVSKSSFIICAMGLTLASHLEPQFVHDILKCCTGYSP